MPQSEMGRAAGFAYRKNGGVKLQIPNPKLQKSSKIQVSNQSLFSAYPLRNPVTRYFFFVQIDTEAGFFIGMGLAGPDRQRFAHDVILVEERPDDVAREFFRGDAGCGHRQMNHRGAADAQFKVAADRSFDSG